eukprot:4575530-Pleurochrysis_carterae.AAC.1
MGVWSASHSNLVCVRRQRWECDATRALAVSERVGEACAMLSRARGAQGGAPCGAECGAHCGAESYAEYDPPKLVR